MDSLSVQKTEKSENDQKYYNHWLIDIVFIVIWPLRSMAERTTQSQIHCLTHNQRRCNPRVKTPVSLTFTMPCKLKSCNPRTELFIQLLRPDEESEPF